LEQLRRGWYIGLFLVQCPTLGIWSSDDVALTEAQMLASANFDRRPRIRAQVLPDDEAASARVRPT
jgi:hypothetical protein